MLNIIEPMVSALLKSNIHFMCDLETVDDKYTFVSSDGSMMTLIKYGGLAQIPGREEYENLVNAFQGYLSTMLSRGDHGIQSVFCRDPDHTHRAIGEALQPARDTARRIGLDVDDILDEKIDVLSYWCAHEFVYFALWSYPSSLPRESLKAHKKKVKAAGKNRPMSTVNAMDPFVLIPQLRERHNSFVSGFLRECKMVHAVAESLTVHEAALAIRMQLDQGFTSSRWRPCLPGDHNTPRQDQGDSDESGLLWEPLNHQLLRRGHHWEGPDEVRVGSIYYTPILLEVYPQQVQPFAALMNKVRGGIPWRISFHIQGGNTTSLPNITKRQIALFFAWAGAENKMIREEFNMLEELGQVGDTTLTIRTVILTWSRTRDQLRANVESISQSIEEWGQCDVMCDAADPSESMIASASGAALSSPASTAWAPTSDVVQMLPIDRPASVWTRGSVLFRAHEGTVWPFEPGSSKQPAFTDLTFAPSGSGKSVLSNVINFSLCLQAGRSRLPRISIIDIGPASAGMVNLVKERLPKDKQHLVIAHKMVMDKDQSINPFDLQLGARRPTPPERVFLNNLLCLLATPAGRKEPYINMAEMVSMVIDEVFDFFDDAHNPKPYMPGTMSDIDKRVRQYGVRVEDGTTWWEITYEMFKRGEIDAAIRAQRMAVPILSDIARVVYNSEPIQAAYGRESGVKTDSGEALTDAFTRMLSDAVKQFPIFSRHTQLDFGNARVISLDLEDVAKEGGDAAAKQTAVCYMLARYVTANDFYLETDYLGYFNETYVNYQRQRIRSIKEDTKRIVYDEFHRTEGQKTVRRQAMVDIREGRKKGVSVSLLSQVMADFDPAMTKQATSIFIMGSHTAASIDDITQVFGLSESESHALKTGRTHGPMRGGTSFLFIYTLKEGRRSQVLSCTSGPKELWAYSTTQEDNRLREEMKVYEQDNVRILDILSDRFPDGSAKGEIEAIRQSMDATRGGEDADSEIYRRLAEESIKAYHAKQQQYKAQVAVERQRAALAEKSESDG